MQDPICIPGVPNTAASLISGSEGLNHYIVIGLCFVLCCTIIAMMVIFLVQRRHGLRFGAMVMYRNRRNGKNGKTPLTYVMRGTLSLAVLSTIALGVMTLSPNAHALESCSSSSSSNSSGNTQTGSSDGNGSTDNNGTTPTDPTIIQPNALMQSITPTQCQALPTYDGTNDSALRTVTDTRGSTTQTYRIAKLADNHCWMLDNLKLGSTTSSTLLTPADSNVATNFTLPQLNDGTRTTDYSTNPGNDYDTPYAYGPVPGDTGSGATNYGYLYNFSAATAGETRTTLPAGSGDAQGSICPANWRMPSGGEWNSPNNDFSNLNAKMAGFSGVTDSGYTSGNYSTFQSNWQNDGPFKGVFSGSWDSGFNYQGSWGGLWSRSAYPDWNDYAVGTDFNSDGVDPDNYWNRDIGLAVRCLLN